MADFDDAVGAWLAYYEARPEAALERAAHMSEHGIPEGHQGEWLGAALAFDPAGAALRALGRHADVS